MMKQGANFTGEISTSKQPITTSIVTLANANSIVIRLSWYTMTNWNINTLWHKLGLGLL